MIFLLLLLVFTTLGNAQKTYELKSNIKTVLMHPKDAPLSFPVYFLNTDQPLVFSFDDLLAEPQDYAYRITHCDAHFNKSSLLPMEYINGNNWDYITDIDYSSAQYSNYIHYQLEIPNSQFEFLRSGNYLLEVYQDDDTSLVVVKKRFVVCEERVQIQANVLPSSSAEYTRSKQQLSFSVFAQNNYQISQPYQDLNVKAFQNQDWNHARSLEPLFVKGDEIEFGVDEQSNFFGSNEYRMLDLKSIHYKPAMVSEIILNNPVEVDLYPDQKRASMAYVFQQDFNGTPIIGNELNIQAENSSEYLKVQFSLKSKHQLDAPVFLTGSVCNPSLEKRNCEMKYDTTYKVYYKHLLLKQGLHSYLYATYNEPKQLFDYTFTEGNHRQTENDYQILIYHKGFSDDYDRCIGYLQINSVNQTQQR